jgi:pimeloyl-ACP methyl ester carboxylesterase
MVHGFTGTRDQLTCYAEAFARAGLAVLTFDYRHFGESEGSPRQIVDIGKQMEDWRSAIAMARTLDRVDSKRIALWGSSLSGGHVINLAAEDPTLGGRRAGPTWRNEFAPRFLFRTPKYVHGTAERIRMPLLVCVAEQDTEANPELAIVHKAEMEMLTSISRDVTKGAGSGAVARVAAVGFRRRESGVSRIGVPRFQAGIKEDESHGFMNCAGPERSRLLPDVTRT